MICAIRMANTHPSGPINLARAIEKRLTQKKSDEQQRKLSGRSNEQTSPVHCGKNGCNGVVKYTENDQGDRLYRCEKCARRWAHDGPDA